MRTLCLAAWLAAAGAGLACDGIHDPSQAGNLVPKTVDEDSTIPVMTLADSKFHAETFGDAGKPVIVMLHAGPGGDYRALLRLNERYDGYALTDDHQVVFWDQRGSGLSRRHDCGVYSLERAVGDLDQLIDRVSPGRKVIFVGDSWGGMYATLYINQHPDKVAGAVLIEPGPLSGQLLESVKGDLFNLDPFSEWLNDYAWDSQFLSPDDHARADYHLLQGARDSEPRLHHQQTDHDPAPVWRMGAVASRCLQQSGMKDGKAVYDFSDHLSAYPTRVLFVASSDNEVTGTAFQERQRVRYPSSDLVTIPSSGHDLAWVHPGETVAVIHSYLGSVPQ